MESAYIGLLQATAASGGPLCTEWLRPENRCELPFYTRGNRYYNDVYVDPYSYDNATEEHRERRVWLRNQSSTVLPVFPTTADL